MEFRERLNHPATVIVVVSLLVIVALIVWLRSGGDDASQMFINKAYFTVDDGKSTFVDDANKLPPFDHQGKQAYRCMVYTKDGNKTRYVGYMVRYPEEAKKRFEAATKSNDQGAAMREGTLLSASAEVKVPGQPDWINVTTPAAIAIMNPTGDPPPEPILP